MAKDYSIKNTTKEERKKIINDALAMSTIDAGEPSEETKRLAQRYVDGEIEISELQQIIIKKYKVN